MNANRRSAVTPRIARHRRAQSGFALIEALVGILIFSIGVLGIVGLQATMTQAQTSAKFRGDASYLASELMGVMAADALANMSNYTTATCASYARCHDWTVKVGGLLPGGTAAIVVNPVADGADIDVTITWTVPNEGTHSYRTSSSIRT